MEVFENAALESAALENLDQMDEVNQDSVLPEFMRMDETKEFAPSMEIQAVEIRDVFLDVPELQYDQWIELGMEERIGTLNDFETRIAEIEHRTPMEVRHEEMRDTLMGYYDGESLVLSEKFLMDNSYDSYKETLNTLFHEGRHAYQDYNLNVERVEQSAEMVQAWDVNNNILGYKEPESIIPELGYLEYYSQPVEVDARVFAEKVINALNI
ncbi:hypothetical protein GPL15_19070 [Clostridium sp. MCC353]|uniref:hypothetical protein n=1 Tax=Clostridium sp. MCC353 TaxID=2592646 RepID=UPI001C01CDAC|nr:hypothetical protein [Clostridium sp. MCC353]MBT9778603.1 hypothetical protein [Clostridium sp. MCC353]